MTLVHAARARKIGRRRQTMARTPTAFGEMPGAPHNAGKVARGS